MFDAIAGRYDLLNDILSAGQVRLWRRAVTRIAGAGPGERVLDLAAGTGTSSLTFTTAGADCVACDFSLGMLQAGGARLAGPRGVRGGRGGLGGRFPPRAGGVWGGSFPPGRTAGGVWGGSFPPGRTAGGVWGSFPREGRGGLGGIVPPGDSASWPATRCCCRSATGRSTW